MDGQDALDGRIVLQLYVMMSAVWGLFLLSGARQMSKDIPDLLQTRSTDYDPPRSHVCVHFDVV